MDLKNIQDLKKFVVELSDKLTASDKFFTAKLASRLEKAAEYEPSDSTTVQMHLFLNKRAQSSNGYLISRAELRDVYNKFYSYNTKCAEYLSEELGEINKIAAPKMYIRSEREGEEIKDLYSRHADQALVSKLESVFDKSASYKSYDPILAEKALKLVIASLPGEPTVSVVDGRDYAILCTATYKTPKGKTSLLVPVDVTNGNVTPPNSFLSNAGFQVLNNRNIIEHVKATAGSFFKVNADSIFNVIKKAKFNTDEIESLDSVDRAVIKLKARNGRNDLTIEGILYQKVDPLVDEVKIKASPMADTFAQKLGSVSGQAEYIHGKQASDMGRYWIQRDLESLGFSNPQVKVSNVTEDKIIYSVSVAGTGFKVPVKVKEGKVSEPTIIISSGGVHEFDAVGVKEAMKQSDIKASESALGYDLVDSNALIGEVEKRCLCGDMQGAGDALAVLSSRGDQTATKYAFDIYSRALDGGLVKQAAPKMKTINLGGRVVEATTFLPVDKVYIDQDGVVQSKYRENMDKTDSVTAAGFLNAKIIMGL
jgi:hypothetical protein